MEPITITILGIDYKISCPPGKEDSLKRSAAALDSRLAAMRASGKMSPEQAAIMVGLHLSDELLQAQADLENIRSSWVGHLDSLNEKLDAALVTKDGQ
ncbi:cell division protein ZapA [Wohlfahrtiimonas sp. G9077]|uniref:cell division protein ZapA n=1 Tax=Wohlfahrtiimonas sp. G9077 TaxID=1980118 RepID=UPI000B996ECF|nr:cell division protein ZapA [Wohlfahrtiimonas sp. G9077]OYQ74394.1 cell division protein ZapA [Wohlfahrtiimonas sp. G9077]